MTFIHPAARASNSAPARPTADRSSRHPQPTRPLLDGPLSDLRRDRLVLNLHRLGPKPVSELLKELVGTDVGLQADALFLLEKYGALDPKLVRALDADTFPPAVFAVTDT